MPRSSRPSDAERPRARRDRPLQPGGAGAALERVPFDAVLLPVNPAEGLRGDGFEQTIVPAARARGMAVVGMKVFARGALLAAEASSPRTPSATRSRPTSTSSSSAATTPPRCGPGPRRRDPRHGLSGVAAGVRGARTAPAANSPTTAGPTAPTRRPPWRPRPWPRGRRRAARPGVPRRRAAGPLRPRARSQLRAERAIALRARAGGENAVVVGRGAREHDAQGDERLVRGSHADGVEPQIEPAARALRPERSARRAATACAFAGSREDSRRRP